MGRQQKPTIEKYIQKDRRKSVNTQSPINYLYRTYQSLSLIAWSRCGSSSHAPTLACALRFPTKSAVRDLVLVVFQEIHSKHIHEAWMPHILSYICVRGVSMAFSSMVGARVRCFNALAHRRFVGQTTNTKLTHRIGETTHKAKHDKPRTAYIIVVSCHTAMEIDLIIFVGFSLKQSTHKRTHTHTHTLAHRLNAVL